MLTKYTYDKIGRLTRVNDQTDTTADATGTTWVYTYDLGGNILTKKAYAYTTESASGLTPAESHTYTYGNSGWKDQLTKFDGTGTTAHECPYVGDMSPYSMWYDSSIVITIHDGTVMDMINNERGRAVGQSVPFIILTIKLHVRSSMT
ncbi:MAG: hypothetical protein MJ142_02585 [Clostridia bacterium]|nr:hypothetical protein [Clostridia bacterium]